MIAAAKMRSGGAGSSSVVGALLTWLGKMHVFIVAVLVLLSFGREEWRRCSELPRSSRGDANGRDAGAGKADIVIWIDTSGSMVEEAQNLNNTLRGFGQYLAQNGIDYKILIIGKGLNLCQSAFDCGLKMLDMARFLLLFIQQTAMTSSQMNCTITEMISCLSLEMMPCSLSLL